MENLNCDVQANNDELKGQNRLFQSYWVETSVVADAVAKANITKNPNQLYTYLGEAIQGLFLAYTNKGKDNFSISIYVYNKEGDMIGRLRAHAYGRGGPKGDSSPHRSFSSVSKYYYAKNLRNDEQSHFSLLRTASRMNGAGISNAALHIVFYNYCNKSFGSTPCSCS